MSEAGDHEILDAMEAELADDEALDDLAGTFRLNERPAWRSDVRSSVVQMPDGTLIDKDEPLARTHPPK